MKIRRQNLRPPLLARDYPPTHVEIVLPPDADKAALYSAVCDAWVDWLIDATDSVDYDLRLEAFNQAVPYAPPRDLGSLGS